MAVSYNVYEAQTTFCSCSIVRLRVRRSSSPGLAVRSLGWWRSLEQRAGDGSPAPGAARSP